MLHRRPLGSTLLDRSKPLPPGFMVALGLKLSPGESLFCNLVEFTFSRAGDFHSIALANH
jgi:hypothetical protein